MPLKVLIAHSEPSKCKEGADFFGGLGYQVSLAENGRDAQGKASAEKFFAVVLDFNLQNHSGLQVFKFIRSKQVTKKVVFIVKDEEILAELGLSREKLESVGGVNVIFGDPSFEQIKEELEGYQGLSAILKQLPKREGASAEVEVSSPDDEFTKVQIEKFYSIGNALFDVYIRLSSSRYLKILHAGDSLDMDRLNKYKNDKGVEYLYFHKNDRKKYLQFLNQLSGSAVTSERIATGTKVGMLGEATDKLMEEIFAEGLRPMIVQEGLQTCRNMQRFVEKEKDLYKYMRKLGEMDPNSFTHSFLVTFLASSIVRQFDWQSEKTIQTVSLAGMLHDIGKAKLPDLIVSSRPEELGPEELKVYQTHPQVGAQMLENVPLISTSVSQIIMHHHEQCDGGGFPYGLTGSRLSMLSKIIIISDHFAHKVLDEKLGSIEAMRSILQDRESGSKFSSKVLEHFCHIFVDPDKIQKDVKVVSGRKAS